MEDSSYAKVFMHPFVLGSAGLVVVIAIGSVAYYSMGTRVPDAQITALTSAATSAITATGTVEPAQNPDLAFASGGRVTSISVQVGDRVAQGERLAGLDTSALAAQRVQALANVDAQQAKLDGLKAGARPEDIAASQAALDKAQQDLTNLYASIGDLSTDSYAKANDAVRTQLDSLFSSGETQSPGLTYESSAQVEINAENDRVLASTALNTWQTRLAVDDANTADLETLVHDEVGYLTTVRALLSDTSKTLDLASNLSATTLASYRSDISNALSEINTATKNLNTVSQAIASQKLTVSQASALLALKQAGALPTDISAQQAQVEQAKASVANIDAQIGNLIISAPFSGTVTSVHVKRGDIVTANMPIISLDPQSALQITGYLSESDAAKVKIGQSADVTLDAYGSGRHFSAVVATVDQSPTMQAGVPAYKVTFQFQQNDPAISSGMTANISIAE